MLREGYLYVKTEPCRAAVACVIAMLNKDYRSWKLTSSMAAGNWQLEAVERSWKLLSVVVSNAAESY